MGNKLNVQFKRCSSNNGTIKLFTAQQHASELFIKESFELWIDTLKFLDLKVEKNLLAPMTSRKMKDAIWESFK